MSEKDPVEDREEFVIRIDSIFRIDRKTREDFLEALMFNDLVIQEKCKELCQYRTDQKNHYLSEYDKAANSDERRKVVGSVSLGFIPK